MGSFVAGGTTGPHLRIHQLQKYNEAGRIFAFVAALLLKLELVACHQMHDTTIQKKKKSKIRRYSLSLPSLFLILPILSPGGRCRPVVFNLCCTYVVVVHAQLSFSASCSEKRSIDLW